MTYEVTWGTGEWPMELMAINRANQTGFLGNVAHKMWRGPVRWEGEGNGVERWDAEPSLGRKRGGWYRLLVELPWILIAFLVPFTPYIGWKCLPPLPPFKGDCSLLKYGNHIIFHALPQQMQNGFSPPQETRKMSCDCYASPILNLLCISHTPSVSPSLLLCQTSWTNSEAPTSHKVLMLCAFKSGWGHLRMRLWNQAGTTEWRHPVSFCLYHSVHPWMLTLSSGARALCPTPPDA